MDMAAQRRAGSVGGHRSWGNTANRAERMRPAQAKSPVGWDWHAQKRFGRDYEQLMPGRQQQVESDRSAYFAEMRRRSAATRRANRANRLRENAPARLPRWGVAVRARHGPRLFSGDRVPGHQ